MAKKRASPAPASPGALLRAKREANGWSQAEVAWALCLAERQMRALEADDYDNLPGRAYILGYWQNYAALLGLADDDAIGAAIEAHKSRLPQRGARIAVRAESRRAHGSLETARRRWALAFGALATVFIASLWLWQGRDNGFSFLPPAVEWRWPAGPETAAPARNGVAVEDSAIADASVLPEPNFPESELANTVAVAETANAVDEPPADSIRHARNPLTRHTRDTLTRHARDPLTRHARDSLTRHARNLLSGRADEPPADSTVIPPPPESPPLETAATETSTTAETNPEQIVLAVSEESWIEVHDGDGQRLLYRNVDRGARLTLRGALPFSVFIGNPAGVSVEYRGRRVPFTAARDGLFARFNIGMP